MSDPAFLEDRVHYLLSQLKVPNLKDICRKKGFRGFSKLKKDNLVDFIIDSLAETVEKDELSSALESLADSVVNFQAYEMLNIEKRVIDIFESDSNFIGTFIPRGEELNTSTLVPSTGKAICTCDDFAEFDAVCSHIKALISLAIASKMCSRTLSTEYGLFEELIELANDFLEKSVTLSSEAMEEYLVEDFAYSGRIEKAQELIKDKFDLSFSPMGIKGHYLGKDKETGELKPVFLINIDRTKRVIIHDCGDFLGRTSRMAKACKHLVAIFLIWGKENPDVRTIWHSFVSCRWRFEHP